MAGDQAAAWEVAGARKRRGRPGAGPATSKGGISGCSCPHGQFPGSTADGDDSQVSGPATEEAARRAEARVRSKADDLRGSTFQAAAEQGLREVASLSAGSSWILCLGIGSVEASVPSACQLAMAWCLAEALGIQRRSWADPQMRAADVRAGEAFGFRATEPAVALAELGSAAGEGPVLLFMPHCDRALYEEVLAVCLGRAGAAPPERPEGADEEVPPQLRATVLVGNSFTLYADRDEQGSVPAGTPGAATENSLIRELRPVTREQVLPEYPGCPEAFNDLSVLSFRP